MDQIATAIVAYGTIVTAAIYLTEAKPLFSAAKSPLKFLGLKAPWGKRITMFVYTAVGAIGAWQSGYITTPEQGWRGWLGVFFVSLLAVIMSYAGHKAGANGKS